MAGAQARVRLCGCVRVECACASPNGFSCGTGANEQHSSAPFARLCKLQVRRHHVARFQGRVEHLLRVSEHPQLVIRLPKPCVPPPVPALAAGGARAGEAQRGGGELHRLLRVVLGVQDVVAQRAGERLPRGVPGGWREGVMSVPRAASSSALSPAAGKRSRSSHRKTIRSIFETPGSRQRCRRCRRQSHFLRSSLSTFINGPPTSESIEAVPRRSALGKAKDIAK